MRERDGDVEVVRREGKRRTLAFAYGLFNWELTKGNLAIFLGVFPRCVTSAKGQLLVTLQFFLIC